MYFSFNEEMSWCKFENKFIIFMIHFLRNQVVAIVNVNSLETKCFDVLVRDPVPLQTRSVRRERHN